MLPPAQDDCFWNIQQDFLICTTIHKARQLGQFTGEIFVRVSLDKAHKNTKTYARSENPYFNEYFVFELKCTLTELLRLTILYEVKKRNACKKSLTCGELLIDMQSVWNQPNRCFFKKWGRLEGPIGDTSSKGGEGKGYLQIDLAIVSQATNTSMLLRPNEGEVMAMNKWQINQDYDDIEKNMLQNSDTASQCNIRYTVFFYRGYLTKKSDYLIQVSFAGFNGKTNVSKSTMTPEWNYAISFAWTYPSLAQTFLIQLLSHEHLQWKSVAEYELHFDEIAFKDKPALGPTFLHLYDSLNPAHYTGRLLVEVRSECFRENPTRDLTVGTATPVDDKRWWQEETFLIEFLAMQGDFLHGNVSNCKLTLKLAEHTSSPVECFLKAYPGKLNYKNVNLKYFRQDVPYKAIYLKAALPDNRHKYDSDYFMQEILDYMTSEMEIFRLFQLKYTNQFHVQTKCFKAIIMSIQNKIKEGIDNKHLEYTGFKDATPWDTNRLFYLQDFFTKLPDELRRMRQRLKTATALYIEDTIEEILHELAQRANELKNLLTSTRVQDEWPNLMIVISISGNKEIGVCRLNAKYFLNPPKDKEASPNSLCWRMRSFVFKDIQCQHTCNHCGCHVAIVQGCLGIVVESERNSYIATVSQDWKQTETFYWTPTIGYTTYKCRLFIHQAKVRPGSDRTGLCDAHVRVILGSQSAETPTEHATLSPIWNVVICFEGIVMPGSMQWHIKSPPLVAIELYDMDKMTSSDYLGCGMLAVSVISGDKADANSREEPDKGFPYIGKLIKTKIALQKFQQLKSLSPPPLTWVPISLNGGVRAEVLMSAELVETHVEEVKKSAVADPTITTGIPNSIRPTMKNFVLEVVFAGFRNYTKVCYGGRHRIKVMMGDLMLMSGLSSSRIKNSINFLVLYASGVVSLPEQLQYWPAIIATDVAVTGRGTEQTLGAVLIPNSKRFLQKDKSAKCVPLDVDAASTIASTVLYMDEVGDAETSPLLATNMKQNVFERVLRAFSGENVKQNQLQASNFDTTSLINENEFTWWTKFYNSIYINSVDHLHNFKHKLLVFSNELEKQAELAHFNDWAEPVRLVHGVKYKKNALPKEETYATLKLHLKVVPCKCGEGDGGDGAMLRPLAAALNPRYQAELQALAELCKIVVRVYVVQGIQFRPQDKHSQSDAYVKIQLGTKTACNRAHYVPNQSNPIFGKCFQLEGVLPREHMLEISVFDRNVFCDDVIGSTYIDLEDRWRTKHRATIGLAHEYSSIGYNKWRDIATPFEILSDLCMKRDIPAPKFINKTIEVDGVIFQDETKIAKAEELQERLSLTALRHFDMLPSFGYVLVPEHVETRSLYRKDCPGIEQGKLQLWIELFEGNRNIPPSIDITPQPPQVFELRVTILNCGDVTLDEKNIFGKYMSDVMVKGWCHDTDQIQTTDIHYRSLNGESNFNWRMIFPIKYSSAEDMMVIRRKGGILEEYEVKQPPMLCLQVFDNDVISRDDFLGSLEINLSNFSEPCSNRRFCSLSDNVTGINFQLPFGVGGNAGSRKPINLFRQKNIKGWFPLHGPIKKNVTDRPVRQNAQQTGKVELELEILTEAEAISNPAGLGRNGPNALPAPARPDTSFNPFTNPLKAFTHILWPAVKKYLIIFGLLALLGLIIWHFFADLPFKLIGL